MGKLTAFKAYDVRGRIPDKLNETLACQIGQAYAAFIRPKRVRRNSLSCSSVSTPSATTLSRKERQADDA